MARAGLIAALLAFAAGAACAQDIASARFDGPTERYPHGVLGDRNEWSVLEITLETGETRRETLPETRVFEDIAPPRIVTLATGARAVLVVESDVDDGARLTLRGADGVIAATPFIGRRFRWLAPIGMADFGDGAPDGIAYVETPHLGRRLVFLRRKGHELVEVASLQGFTNHAIGENYITSAVRDCGTGAEAVLTDGARREIIAARIDGGAVVTRVLGPYAGPESVAAAARCD